MFQNPRRSHRPGHDDRCIVSIYSTQLCSRIQWRTRKNENRWWETNEARSTIKVVMCNAVKWRCWTNDVRVFSIGVIFVFQSRNILYSDWAVSRLFPSKGSLVSTWDLVICITVAYWLNSEHAPWLPQRPLHFNLHDSSLLKSHYNLRDTGGRLLQKIGVFQSQQVPS